MDQKLSSSRRTGDLSSSGSDSDPDREFSGDDDDRNHKHRRREIRSQSSEFDASQSVSSRPFNKQNKPFDNGHPLRGNGSRNGGWRNSSFNASESDLLKSDKRHFDMPMFSRPQMDLNQRIGLGQTYHGDSGFARGRGREAWNPHAPRFGSMEFSQASLQGSVSSNLYAGRGLPNVAGVHTAPWNPYGLLPGIPSGGLDAMHSLGASSTLRPPSHTGIIRQKCRDFEERGFCLRGDMCPMEHGVNRIVVDDVQSLSKFNLPVSLTGGNTLGVGGGSRPLPAGTASTNLSVNNAKFQRETGKSKSLRKETNSDVGCNGNFTCSTAAVNDFYDPDQPLWNKNGPDTTTALSQPCSLEIQEAEPILDGDPSSATPGVVHNGTHNLTSSSLGDLHGSNSSRPDLKGKVSVVPNSSGHDDYTKSKEETLNKKQNISVHGIHILPEDKGTSFMDESQKRLKGSSRNTQKSQQKAMRTLFVNGIPQKVNNKEALRSHFQKFGEIIDIYIPLNSERAFVQLSTREEAEAALKAPDAVMGNRFIKLWWANRDNIPDSGFSTVTPYSVSAQLSFSSKGRSNQLPVPMANATHALSTNSKVNTAPVSSGSLISPNQSKHVSTSGLAALVPSQKKLENLEVLKEELRKKQELLDQKRNEFKRQLDRLEKQKQAAGVKGELSLEQPAKRHKGVMANDVAEKVASHSADISGSITLSRVEEVAEKTKPVDKHSEQTVSLRMVTLPLMATDDVIRNSRKLDSESKAFMIVPPLPSDFTDVVTLKEHFSLYGEVSKVELVNVDSDECIAALISFKSHLSADKAFQSAKSWKGHDLQFTWVSRNIIRNDGCPSSAEKPMDVDIATQKILQEANPQSDEDLKGTSTNITDEVAKPEEKQSPCKEMFKGQLLQDDTENVHNIQPAKENIEEHETQLSEENEFSKKTEKEKSSHEDSVKTLEEQLSDEEVRTSNEGLLSHNQIDSLNEEHYIDDVEEHEEQTCDDQEQSEDDIM